MSAQPSSARTSNDPVLVDYKHYTVEFEDDTVRVLRIRHGPREKSTMYSHPPLVAVMITDSKIRFIHPDGRLEDVHVGAGNVLRFSEAHDRMAENLSDQPFEVIAVELKT